MSATVVLLHGLGGSPFDWEAAAERLGHPAVLPTLLAHGGRGRPERLDFPALAEDALAQVDRVTTGPVVLAGISLGAAVAATICSLHPERVLGLLHVAPAWVDRPEPANLRRLQKLGRILEHDGVEAAWALVRALPPVAGWAAADRAGHEARFRAADAAATGHAMQHLPGQLPVLDAEALRAVPSRVVTWHHDPIHPPEVAAAIAACAGVGAEVRDRPADRAEEAALLAGLVGDLAAG